MREFALLQALHDHIETIRTIILARSGGRSDTCIYSTGVLLRTLRELALPAHPLTVHATAINRDWLEYADLINRGGDPDLILQRLTEEGKTPKMVGIGFGPNGETSGRSPSGGWNGHLVAVTEPLRILQEDGSYLWPRYLIDSSLDQGSRPESGLLLRPLVSPVPSDFVQEGGVLESPDGSVAVRYETSPEDVSYMDAPDWGMAWEHESGTVLSRKFAQMIRLAIRPG